MRKVLTYALGALTLCVPGAIGCTSYTAQPACHIVAPSADDGGVPTGWEYEHGVWYSRDELGEHVAGYALAEDSTVWDTARCAQIDGAS